VIFDNIGPIVDLSKDDIYIVHFCLTFDCKNFGNGPQVSTKVIPFASAKIFAPEKKCKKVGRTATIAIFTVVINQSIVYTYYEWYLVIIQMVHV
jgi:hypothetical protein